MKKLFIATVIACGLFMADHVMASVPAPPSNNHYYVDEANLITEVDRKKIDALATALYDEKKTPIFVVTVSSLASYQAQELGVEKFTQQVFDQWGIGSQSLNYGMLLLVSKEDRKARIEFGKAWQHRYDAEADTIMQDVLVPAFKKANYSAGIVDATTELDHLARHQKMEPEKVSSWIYVAVIVSVIFLVMIVISLFRSGRKGWAWTLIAALGVIVMLLFVLLRAGGSSRSGGSSGGGGSSGSW